MHIFKIKFIHWNGYLFIKTEQNDLSLFLDCVNNIKYWIPSKKKIYKENSLLYYPIVLVHLFLNKILLFDWWKFRTVDISWNDFQCLFMIKTFYLIRQINKFYFQKIDPSYRFFKLAWIEQSSEYLFKNSRYGSTNSFSCLIFSLERKHHKICYVPSIMKMIPIKFMCR